ncbi:ESX secretion-associated protein EspG [Mycolicibacterium sp. Y3]
MPKAVELTVDAAWFIADQEDAGSFPWVLAIIPPYRDQSDRAAFASRQTAELDRLGVVEDGQISPAVRQWIRIVCEPECWLELRYVRGVDGKRLRGIVARRHGETVVALRNAQFITFSPVGGDVDHRFAEIVTAGLPRREPADFAEFELPAHVGAKADEQIRDGADLFRVMDYLGIPDSARPVVSAVFDSPQSYVEVVAGQRCGAARHTTDVGVAVVDTVAGRVVVSPARAFDGRWVSTFAPGTPAAITRSVTELIATLPDGEYAGQ